MKRRDILKLFGLLPFIPSIAKAEKVLPKIDEYSTPVFDFGNDDFTVEYWLWKDTWHHVAMTRNSNTLTAFINGEEHSSTKINVELTKLTDPVSGFDFSFKKGHYFLDFKDKSGVLDDLKVYDSNYTIGQTNRNIV